jgi:hypothetical protein
MRSPTEWNNYHRQRFKYKNGFLPGDVIGPLYTGSGVTKQGVFKMYCPGYKSHCMVRWDGDELDTRIAAVKLRLVSRGGVPHDPDA